MKNNIDTAYDTSFREIEAAEKELLRSFRQQRAALDDNGINVFHDIFADYGRIFAKA